MSQANPQASEASTDDYRSLVDEDRQYLDTLTWTTGTCFRRLPECSARVTWLHIEQGTLPGGRAEICRLHAGYKLHLRRMQAQNLGDRGYQPDINAD